MTGALDRLEGNTLIVDDHTSSLAIVHPRSPSVHHRLTQAVDPSLSADSGHSTVDITAEHKDSPVGLVDETLPQRHNRVLVLVDVGDLAQPRPVGGFHMNGLLDGGLVQVGGHVVVDARIESGVVRRVAVHGSPARNIFGPLSGFRVVQAHRSVNIISIQNRGQVGDGLDHSRLAVTRRLSVDTSAVGQEIRPSAGLTGSEILGFGDDHVGVQEGQVGPLVGSTIPIGLSTGVAHHNTLHVQPRGVASLDAIENLSGQLRAVLSTIGLSSDVEVVGLVLREELEPVEKELVVLVGSLVVVGDVLKFVIRVREAHTNRSLQVDDVGDSVPRVLIQRQSGAVGIGAEGAMLREETHQGGGTRATIHPQEHRIVSGVALTLHKPVEKVGVVLLVDVDITRVHREVEGLYTAGHTGQIGDQLA